MLKNFSRKSGFSTKREKWYDKNSKPYPYDYNLILILKLGTGCLRAYELKYFILTSTPTYLVTKFKIRISVKSQNSESLSFLLL